MKSKILASNQGFSLLEQVINSWLADNPKVEIVAMSYADNNSYCSVLIIYRNAS